MSAPPPPPPPQCSTCHCPLDPGSLCPTCSPQSVEDECEEAVATPESRTPSLQEETAATESPASGLQIVPRSLHPSTPATDATRGVAAQEPGFRPFLLLSSSNPSGTAAPPPILHIMEMVSLFASRLFRESETRDTPATHDSGIIDLSQPPDPGARVLQQMNQGFSRDLSRTSDHGAVVSQQVNPEAFLGLDPTLDTPGVHSSELHLHEPRASRMLDEGETLHDGNTLPGDGVDSLSRLLHLLSRTGRRGAGNGNHRLTDSILRPALHMLIQRMLEGEIERYGSPPASKAAIEAMPTLTIGKQLAEVDELHCAVCKEAFQLGGKVREMPCKHLYHSDCILPWLALHSSCPLCRYEMPVQEVTDSEPSAAEGSSPERGQTGGGLEGDGRHHGFAIVGVSGPSVNALSIFVFEFSIRDGTPTQNDQEEQQVEDDTVDDGNESNMPSSVTQSQVSSEAEEPESTAVQTEAPTARGEQRSSSESSLASRSRSIFSWVFQHNDSPRTSGRQIEDSNPDGANHTSQRPNTSSDTGDDSHSHSGRGRSFWW